jgi:hypothetical protein
VKSGCANGFLKSIVIMLPSASTFVVGAAVLFVFIFVLLSSAFMWAWLPRFFIFVFILSAAALVAGLPLWWAYDAETTFHFNNRSLLLVFVPTLKSVHNMPVHIQCIFQEIPLEATENVASFAFLFFPSSNLLFLVS